MHSIGQTTAAATAAAAAAVAIAAVLTAYTCDVRCTPPSALLTFARLQQHFFAVF